MSVVLHCFKYVRGTNVLKNGDILDETESFSLFIESSYDLENVVVLITDIPLNIVKVNSSRAKFCYILDDDSVRLYFKTQDFDKVFDVYRTVYFNNIVNLEQDFYKLFINYPIGICEISIYDDRLGKNLATHHLNIVSAKIESREFSTLVSYVESKGSSIWAKYSLLRHQAEGTDIEDRLDWLLTFCGNFISLFKNFYLPHYAIDKISSLIPNRQVEDFHESTMVSEESFHWLLGNLDVLTPTPSYDLNKIIINNRPFFPAEILAERLQDNTDVVENQLIHGFFSELSGFLINVISKCDLEISANKRSTFENLVSYYAFNRKLKQAKIFLSGIENIKAFLEKEIPVSKETLDFMHINKIESKEHYYFVYENLLKWLIYKDANYSLDSTYFKGITRLDQLFERGCHYKLIDILQNLGYEIHLDEFANEIDYSKISFAKGGKSHILYFQRVPDSLTTIRKGRGNLLPDYLLMIDSENYIIIDAKYKKDTTITKYDYPELTLKYLHGIGPKDSFSPKALALLILYPDKNNSIDFYHKDPFSLNSVSPAIPIIGSLGVNFENDNTALETTIEKLISLVEV